VLGLRRLREPTLERILEFCARDPVERVFLEDVARRGLGRFAGLADGRELVALCHLGANLVPSGQGCGAFASVAARSPARMLLGETRAVTELWDAARSKLPKAKDDRPGQPVFVIDEAPPTGGTGLRPARLGDLELLVPACDATRTAFAGARGRRSRRAAPGSGSRTAQSASRPRPRRGRRARSSCSRSGPTRRFAAVPTRPGRSPI
jgi:hypothetical protein